MATQKNIQVKKSMTWAVALLITGSITTATYAVPQVIVNDPKTGQPLTNQPTVASTVIASQVSPTQNPNAPSLAQLNQPNDSQLSQANQQLLTTNADLQRQVASLTTQNNVLVNEHSGQLFIYGAFTALLATIFGVVLGWLIFGRSKATW